MARIIDKDTRIIDIDFGPVDVGLGRDADAFNPTTLTLELNGTDQIIANVAATNAGAGSYVQYQRLDLSFMMQQNEVMQPVDVSVQRTTPVPLGFSNDGNNFDQIEEFIYIFTRPLNNDNIATLNVGEYDAFRQMGLERAENLGFANVAGFGNSEQWPNQEQCIYAEKRMYSNNLNNAATQTNGALTNTAAYNELLGMPSLDSVTTWGSLSTITGPNLHCYRIVIDRSQTFPPLAGTFANVPQVGSTLRKWPPVNVSFLCKNPNYTEGEYITRLANAMNSVEEGGRTA